MTIVALDREMLKREIIPTGPIQIRPVRPTPSVGPPVLRLAFVIDVDFPVSPDGNLVKLRLPPRNTEKLEVINGAGGRVRCTNVGESEGKICFIFDPDEPSFIPQTRLNPIPRGPLSNLPRSDGGTVRITKDSFIVHVDTLHPGNAFIDASTATSANTLTIEVRAPKLASVPGFGPPTKTRSGSQFISADDSEPSPGGARGDNGGRPVNSKRF